MFRVDSVIKGPMKDVIGLRVIDGNTGDKYSLKVEDNSIMIITVSKDIVKCRVPKFVDSIATSAFEGCYSLEEVILPKRVREIGNSAFENCKRLRSIEILGKIEEIQKDTFRNCIMLERVIVHEGLRKIHLSAFKGCKLLREITIQKEKKRYRGLTDVKKEIDVLKVENSAVMSIT